MTTRRTGSLLFLAAIFFTQSGYNDCTGDVLHDPGFDVWCGDHLCSWDVEKGDVRKAPTWHESDLGVELVGDDAAISQLSLDPPVTCLRFSLVADVSEDATVTLEMDLDADGTVEYERAIPTSHWAELDYRVELEGQSDILFRLRKTGSGRAVLAQIRAVRDDPECGGDTVATERPLGADCAGFFGADDAVCAAGVCTPGQFACGECRDDADCDGGSVCGLEARVAPPLEPYRSCVAPASRGLGEMCAVDGECAGGVCCEGFCSGCCGEPSDAVCEPGRSCVADPDAPPGEHWCSPGDGAPGDACRRDQQCASGACAGGEPMMVCTSDGRPCAVDDDCPLAGQGGECIEAGRTGGRCR